MLVALIAVAVAALVLLFMALRYKAALGRLAAEQGREQKGEAEAARLREELALLTANHQRHALFLQMRATAARNELGMEVSEALAKSEPKQVQKLIRDRLTLDEAAWADFLERFNSLYNNFSLRLSERHPDLTRTEMRLCCYLRMGLPTKEIAALLGVSPRSVEMTRYRLRKKLALPAEANLAEYIANL